MGINKTGGFQGGDPPAAPSPTPIARDGFSGGEAIQKSFPGGGGQITTAQLQSILPQGSSSSVTPSTTSVPSSNPGSGQK